MQLADGVGIKRGKKTICALGSHMCLPFYLISKKKRLTNYKKKAFRAKKA